MKKSNWFALEWDISRLKKILIVMKTTILLLLISGLSVFASESYAQTKTITLHLQNASLKEVLQQIEDQSEFRFMYSEKLIDVQRKVSVNFENQKINEVLNQLFIDTDVNYKLKDRFILLATPEVNTNDFIVQQQKTVSGKVTDSGGLPLPGVTIVVKGTTTGTVTNADGKYSMPNVPSGATLIFSFVGMKSQEIVVGNQTQINVTLQADVISLEEVVAIGYGYQKKESITSSVSTVDNEELAENNTASMASGVLGRLTGITSIQASGAPGPNQTLLFVRGMATTGSTAPLYVNMVQGAQMESYWLLPKEDRQGKRYLAIATIWDYSNRPGYQNS